MRVEGDSLTFSQVESLLLEKADVLHDLGFPISLISQSESCDLQPIDTRPQSESGDLLSESRDLQPIDREQSENQSE